MKIAMRGTRDLATDELSVLPKSNQRKTPHRMYKCQIPVRLGQNPPYIVSCAHYVN